MDFLTCFSVHRTTVVAATLAETIAGADVPTMMTTGLTGATVGVEATVSDLHARTVAAVTLATVIVGAAAATPAVTLVADVDATPAIAAAATDVD